MKTATCIRMVLLALLFGSSRTSAQFVFLNDNRSVNASGSTNGVLVYGQTNAPPAFGPFNGGVGGGSSVGASGYISSGASQTSYLMPNAIIVTNNISAGYN